MFRELCYPFSLPPLSPAAHTSGSGGLGVLVGGTLAGLLSIDGRRGRIDWARMSNRDAGGRGQSAVAMAAHSRGYYRNWGISLHPRHAHPSPPTCDSISPIITSSPAGHFSIFRPSAGTQLKPHLTCPPRKSKEASKSNGDLK